MFCLFSLISVERRAKIYAAPSIEMLKKAMESANGFMPDEKPIWEGDEDAMAKMCGLR